MLISGFIKMGNFKRHVPCDKCGSSDGNAIYEDGSSYCWVCKNVEQSPNVLVPKIKRGNYKLINEISYEALVKRSIREDTCKKYGYGIANYNGKRVQVATYKDSSGAPVAQKIRDKDKKFSWVGDGQGVNLFGQHLFSEGKILTVCEGEVDTLTVSQVFDNKWAVVGVPHGAQSAVKYIAANLDFCNSFDKVILCFDMDKPGQDAAKECAELFTPGKAAIAYLPEKDANDMLVKGLTKELINAVYSAKVFRPDGIVSSKDTWELILAEDNNETADYPFDDLNTITGGLKKGALVTVCAGSGIGKSLFCKEVAYHLLQQGKKVGYIALEESVKRTMQGLMSIRLNKPLHLNHTLVDVAELKEAWDEVASDNLYLYDHFGSTDSDNLLNKIRYMNKALGCDYIFLDHLSIVMSGASASLDERRLIDNTMTNLRTLVEETGISLTIVSHLKRIEGNRSHEDGVAVSLSHLRGSQSIAQLSDQVLALSRSTTSDTKDLTTLSVLKNRYSGETGEAATLKYEPTTGRLKQTDPLETTSESVSF